MYPLVTPDIPYGTIINEDMLGKVSQLKYVNHDIKDTMMFPELALREYLEQKLDLVTRKTILVTNLWARGLE
jgi:hypothetical protein